MKSFIIAALGFTSAVVGHGFVKDICVNGYYYKMFDPNVMKSGEPNIAGWSIPNDGPVTDVLSKAIACNSGSIPGTAYAHAGAGDEITFFWNTWPESHKGPAITYLAPATSEDPTTLNFFKIDQAGLLKDGTWITDSILKNNISYTVKVPNDIKAGRYILRHELVALHDAREVKGAQFYPVCINLEISGFGAAEPTDTVRFPGAYQPDDPGILINVWYPKPTSYVIPGPKLYTGSILGDLGDGPKVPSTMPTGGRYPYTNGTGTYPVSTHPPNGEGTGAEHDEQLKDPKAEHDEEPQDPETEHDGQPKKNDPEDDHHDQPKPKGPKTGYLEQPKGKDPKAKHPGQEPDVTVTLTRTVTVDVWLPEETGTPTSAPEDEQTVVTVSKTVTVTVTATSSICAPARRFRSR